MLFYLYSIEFTYFFSIYDFFKTARFFFLSSSKTILFFVALRSHDQRMKLLQKEEISKVCNLLTIRLHVINFHALQIFSVF